ncbi:hypothetical protein [Phaeodactylibacter sp.]|uniref:hypothetical protein n=1 Tax=Phaeodactylibacter sp. TaxID=1940289 RepID=UPI0025CC20DC|nr:hypothetical protein [Phaeodactylibacter sp.]MCI4650965.1 hypothetical protein [Phaeodactylibacter sp.]MCI5092364.1 hypothetical protein [Phaeodactylibacter sp.]
MSLISTRSISGSTEYTEMSNISISEGIHVLIGVLSVLGMVHFLNIEKALGLEQLLWVVVIGFIAYNIFSQSLRLPLLFVLNVIAIFILFGWIDGGLLLLLGLGLFAIVDADTSVRNRTALLLIITALLATARLGYLPFYHGSTLLPVLGALFMFRSILYLYEQKYIQASSPIWIRLNYFFILPNLVFFIFPVVDYKTFTQSYYKKPAFETYKKGVLWMANGVFHLFLYRLIYYYAIPDPAKINNVYSWLQYAIASYALIVRLAGIFHFSAGVICLFGFDLPPTFRHYFFANSFSDLWRRINMYWRDFVMKVFYYPIYFKVKQIGTVRAIVVSILLTFVVNWFLHAYQWLWLKGTVLLTVQDTTFWAIFGLAVAANSYYQAHRRPKRKDPKLFYWKDSIELSARVLGVFSFMTFLWSWWTAPSVSAWLKGLLVWKTVSPAQLGVIFGVAGGIVLVGTLFQFLEFQYRQTAKPVVGGGSDWRYAFATLVLLLLASVGAIPFFQQSVASSFAIDIEPVLTTKLNARDRSAQFQGYYETMLAENSILDSPLEELNKDRPEQWEQLHTTGAIIKMDDITAKRLRPNLDMEFKGGHFTTNTFGLRDRPTTQRKPDGVFRIALLGGSIEMGSGVDTDETYENLFEDRLNASNSLDNYEKVEILNFSVSGIHLPQHFAIFESRATPFKPDAVIYTSHSNEASRIAKNLAKLHSAGINIEDAYLKEFFSSLRLPKVPSAGDYAAALEPKMDTFIHWGLNRIKTHADQIGAIPIWAMVPALDGVETPAENDRLLKLAKQLGFHILDLRNYYEGYEVEEIILGSWDRHPNQLGHQLMAEKIYTEFMNNTSLLEAIRKNPQQK